MVKRWHGLDFHHEWLVQQNVGQGCSFLWIWQRFRTSGNITRLFTYVSIWSCTVGAALSYSFDQFYFLAEQQQSPQSIPASSPASSNTGPVSSSSTSLSSSPATSPSNSVAALRPVSQWILKLPLFLNHQNLCVFPTYEFVLQMIVPEANLLPLIFCL